MYDVAGPPRPSATGAVLFRRYRAPMANGAAQGAATRAPVPARGADTLGKRQDLPNLSKRLFGFIRIFLRSEAPYRLWAGLPHGGDVALAVSTAPVAPADPVPTSVFEEKPC